MTAEKNPTQIKILQEKLNYIIRQLDDLEYVESSRMQIELLSQIKDEILAELIDHEIQREFRIIEFQNQ